MKSRFLKITFAAALAVVAGVTAYHAQDKETLSDLALANVEALARIEGDGGDGGTKCDNFNGYRRIREGNERIYDCCYIEQVGSGKDDCRRW